MGPERNLEQLVVEFGDLRKRVERAGGYQADAGSAAASSTTGPPLQGALPRPNTGHRWAELSDFSSCF